MGYHRYDPSSSALVRHVLLVQAGEHAGVVAVVRGVRPVQLLRRRHGGDGARVVCVVRHPQGRLVLDEVVEAAAPVKLDCRHRVQVLDVRARPHPQRGSTQGHAPHRGAAPQQAVAVATQHHVTANRKRENGHGLGEGGTTTWRRRGHA